MPIRFIIISFANIRGWRMWNEIGSL